LWRDLSNESGWFVKNFLFIFPAVLLFVKPSLRRGGLKSIA